jgi:hypothetical protein
MRSSVTSGLSIFRHNLIHCLYRLDERSICHLLGYKVQPNGC